MAFEKATKAGVKSLIGIYGGSGSGKTLSALLLARGLVGPNGFVAVIDTENKRGQLYADMIPHGYDIDQLNAPFSSKKYMDMIEQAEAACGDRDGALVIDSASHEWEGVGGVISAAEGIAESRAQRNNKDWNGAVAFGDWKAPKAEHKHMVLKMLGSKLHIICCMRAQRKSHQIEKKDYEKHGIKSSANTTITQDDFQTPIQDGNFIYEFTVNIELSNEHPGVPIIRKIHEQLWPAFPDGKQISVETGETIAAWIQDGGHKTADDVDAVEDASHAATCGIDKYEKHFMALTANQRKMLVQGGWHATNKETAATADNEIAARGEVQS